MSKAILVMDMPEKCYICPFYYETRDEDDDYVSKCEVLNNNTIDGFTEKYDGCPLKKLPEKMKYHDGIYNGQVKGWNLCLEEILKESNQSES